MNPPRFPTSLRLALVFLTGLLPILSAPAAVVINWQAPQNITGDSNVSTLGAFISAGNAGGLATTVNGVTFAAYTFGGSNTFDAAAPSPTFGGGSANPWNGLSTNYKNLLGAGLYETTPGSTSASLTLSGLTINQTYLVQFWVDDSRDDIVNVSRWTRFLTVTGDSSTSSALDYNVQNQLGGLGQYVTGTFIADATSVAFTFQAGNTDGSGTAAVQLNAWQLRAIPEPSSALLLVAGSGACFFLRNRRRFNAGSSLA